LQTVQDAKDLLKSCEMLDDYETAPRPNPVPPSRTSPSHPFPSQQNDRTANNNHFVRQTYYSRSSDFTRSGRNCLAHMQEIGRTLANHRRSQETSQLPRTEGLQNLNPNSPVFS